MNVSPMNESSQSNLEEASTFDFSTLVNILIGKWYWFLFSTLLFLLIGVSYIYFTPKTYQKTATLLIKEEKKGGGVSQASAFADIAGVSGLSMSNTDNEMQILQSRTLMQEVVYSLGLHITYTQRKAFRTEELYEYTPFRLREKERGTLIPSDLTVTPLSETEFQVKMQTYSVPSDTRIDTTFTARFNEETRFPFGIATLQSYPQLLHYYIGKPIELHIASPKNTASAYLHNLQVSLQSKMGSIVRVTMQASRPAKAEDVLNYLLDQYNRDAINDKNLVLDHTATFINDRLITIREELGDVDSRIESYKRATLSTNTQAESQVYLQSATSLEEKRSATDIQLSLVSILSNFLQRDGNSRELLPYNIGLDNAGLNQQIQNYNDNMIRLNRMVAASSERSPVVVDLSSSLQAARASIVKTVADMQRSLLLQQKQLDSRTQRTAGRIEAVSTNERNVQSITRDQKIKSELYLYLLNKSEENAIARSTTESNGRIIDKAYGGDAPVAPRSLQILLALLLVGFILPAAWFLLKDMMDTKVRGRSDVAKVVKAPILGEIPQRTDLAEVKKQIMVVQPKSGGQISEAFRILRTNLSFINTEGKNQIFAFTSSMPGEGKTFVTANLAMTLALAGKRVCLVDLDLRRCSLSKAFELRGHHGVTDYLVGRCTNVQELIKTTSFSEQLFVLPTGIIPPNPAELLMNKRFDQLMAELREQFDYIFLDNPPVHLVADTTIANRVADITLFVVRAGVLDRRELEAIQTLYTEKSLRNLSLVVNGVDYEQLYYSVGYKGYGKRYGYGKYGYTYSKYEEESIS